MIREISTLPQGCVLAGSKMNIICYADDILLLAPSSTGLQILLNKLVYRLNELSLKINIQKSSYILFKCKRHVTGHEIFLDGRRLSQVSKCVYLGVTLTESMSINEDTERVTGTFLRQFHGIYSKFFRSQGPVLYHLFKSYAMSFYGMETWFHNVTKQSLKKVSVAYHRAVKRICGLNLWDSNHAACETVGVEIFQHLYAKRLIRFMYRLFSSCSPCTVHMRYYFEVHFPY